MGYHIQYGKTIVKTAVQIPTTGRKHYSLLVIVLLFVTMLGYAAYSYKDTLQQYIWPGDAMVTATALDTFVQDIMAGESLKDSVTSFCLEIVQHADIPG